MAGARLGQGRAARAGQRRRVLADGPAQAFGLEGAMDRGPDPPEFAEWTATTCRPALTCVGRSRSVIPVKQATVFATARGLYELHLNGRRVGDALLAPGWTDYNKHIEYQTYDVTSALQSGENTVGAILGDGWYSGYVGFARKRNLYGDRPELRLQIDIEYRDGTRQIVRTDGRGSEGPARSPTPTCCRASRTTPARN